MFPAVTYSSHFASHRRPERPLRENLDTNRVNTPGHQRSAIVNNLNIALSGLYPNHPKVRPTASQLLTPYSPLSFLLSKTSRTTFSSSSSVSSSSPLQSHQSSKAERLPRYCTSSEAEVTPKASSFTPPSKLRFPFGFASHSSLPRRHTTVHDHDRPSYTPRPSLDSISSSTSSHSWLDIKERKSPPPPLHINDSNFRPKKHKPTAIEIIAPGPPRVESRLSSYGIDLPSPAPATSKSPGTPSEEDLKLRRHDKVMRTLGERVPVTLVHGVPKIPNITVFPEPPSPNGSDDTAARETTTKKLARRASMTLTSVTANLLPSTHSHARSKSDLLHSPSPESNPATPTPLSFASRTYTPSEVTAAPTRHNTHARPESLFSPIVFAKHILETPAPPSARALCPDPEDKDDGTCPTTRASLSTATVPPTSHITHDGICDRIPPLPSPTSRSGPCAPGRSEALSSAADAHVRPRPESLMTLSSPLVFAKHAALVLPPMHAFRFVIDADADGDGDGDREGELDEDEDDASCQEDEDQDEEDEDLHRRQGQRNLVHAQSDGGHGRGGLHSDPHLPLHPRADTPFQDYTTPHDHEAREGYLAPGGTWGRGGGLGKDLVQRKERRQGWSGEWNQPDMQDVISKLRNLK